MSRKNQSTARKLETVETFTFVPPHKFVAIVNAARGEASTNESPRKIRDRRAPTVLTTYAHFLDLMLMRARIASDAKRAVRAARIGAKRRGAKPYTLGQIRAHIKYRAKHQPEIRALYVRDAAKL